MFEKLLLAGAVTFSVYIFSGLDLPVSFRLPLAAIPAAASFSSDVNNVDKVQAVSSEYRGNLLPVSAAIANNLD